MRPSKFASGHGKPSASSHAGRRESIARRTRHVRSRRSIRGSRGARAARMRHPTDMQEATAAHNPSAPPTGFLREIEGLRAVAILAVMLHRFWPDRGPLAAHARIAEIGWMGVDLFFVISGLLITGILVDSR